MKTSSLIASLLFIVLCSNSIVCQEAKNTLYASNYGTDSNLNTDVATSVNNPTSKVDAKEDVVINMAMIESFRRYYNKIEPFSLTDFIGTDPNEMSIKYMAYMRARLHPESLKEALATELNSVNASLKEKNNINMSNLAYNETTTHKSTVITPATENNNTPALLKKNTYKSIKKVNGVKWIEIK